MTSAESTPAAAPKARSEPRPAAADTGTGTGTGTGIGPGAGAGAHNPRLAAFADAGLILLFLALTFLLGVFPLKDTDIFWHIRTGQIIRQSGDVPRHDLFTYTRGDAPWIDLHWIFQIGVSWLHERGGAVALNLAKCVITCVAMLILLACRRRDWPIWAFLVAWLPALLVLGGRMYVRPETLSLLYLAIFFAVLTRWDRHPWLVAILPPVQVAWVNSHGLFVFGPIVLVMALLDAATRPRSLAPGPGRWWRIAGIGSLATLAACLFNPYGIRGAMYPIELAGTMSNEVFSLSIAELTPIPEWIRRHGLANLPLQLHFLTMALGGLSFLVPLAWSIAVSFSRSPATNPAAAAVGTADEPARLPRGRKEPADAGSARRRKKARANRQTTGGRASEPAPATWRLSPFRLLLFAAFSYLSLQATRNSHQFAAVVGSVTAWNFAEWVAAIRRRRAERQGAEATPAPGPAIGTPRLAAAGTIAAVIAWVGSGVFYRMTGEGRTISLGEAPLFFAHEAARFAGRPELPARFLSFHNGHASLFEYYHGPDRKVVTDPRLEVAGATLFGEYMRLDSELKLNVSGWRATLDRFERPVIMVDHENKNWMNGATLLADSLWRCVWFDPIVSVFVHGSFEDAVRRYAVDFAARHFRPDTSARDRTLDERLALARAFRSYVTALPPHRTDLVWPLVWLGRDECRGLLAADADSAVAWTLLGQTEVFRDPAPAFPPSPRYRLAFDPVADLSLVRATAALRRALERLPDDLTILTALEDAFARRGMHEAALEVHDRFARLAARHPAAAKLMEQSEARRGVYVRGLGEPPATTWRNLAELDRLVESLLASGRARAAADVLAEASPPERAEWEILDRMATLRLHLGEPARARALWQQGIGTAPDAAVAAARIAVTHLAEEDFEAARTAYRRALAARSGLFEACYGLAVLELDAGDAAAAHELARRAVAAAPDEHSRGAAALIARAVERFAVR